MESNRADVRKITTPRLRNQGAFSYWSKRVFLRPVNQAVMMTCPFVSKRVEAPCSMKPGEHQKVSGCTFVCIHHNRVHQQEARTTDGTDALVASVRLDTPLTLQASRPTRHHHTSSVTDSQPRAIEFVLEFSDKSPVPGRARSDAREHKHLKVDPQKHYDTFQNDADRPTNGDGASDTASGDSSSPDGTSEEDWEMPEEHDADEMWSEDGETRIIRLIGGGADPVKVKELQNQNAQLEAKNKELIDQLAIAQNRVNELDSLETDYRQQSVKVKKQAADLAVARNDLKTYMAYAEELKEHTTKVHQTAVDPDRAAGLLRYLSGRAQLEQRQLVERKRVQSSQARPVLPYWVNIPRIAKYAFTSEFVRRLSNWVPIDPVFQPQVADDESSQTSSQRLDWARQQQKLLTQNGAKVVIYFVVTTTSRYVETLEQDSCWQQFIRSKPEDAVVVLVVFNAGGRCVDIQPAAARDYPMHVEPDMVLQFRYEDSDHSFIVDDRARNNLRQIAMRIAQRYDIELNAKEDSNLDDLIEFVRGLIRTE